MKIKITAPSIILRIYFVSVIFFLFFRIILFFSHLNEIKVNGQIHILYILYSFLMGLRYDLLVSGFILIIPYFLLISYDYSQKKILKKISFWWVFTILSLGLMLTAGNVVYFNNFYKHIDSQTLQWFDHPITVLGMIFGEFSYWYMFIIFFIVLFIFYKILNHIFYKKHRKAILSKKTAFAYYFIGFIIMFITIRGTIHGAPLRNQDAFKYNNAFLNKLSQNPVFVFEKSIETKSYYKIHPLKMMGNTIAIKNLQKYYGIIQPKFKYPLARRVVNDTNLTNSNNKKNVVLVFMESLGAWKMKTFGDKEKRSPFIDSLFNNSIAFTNMYSSGTHTYCGVYSVNCGYPILFDRHPLKMVPTKIYYGISKILKENGYQTTFFIPHGLEFDNNGEFLHENAYDRIYFNKDYPRDSIRTIWGVDDRFLFNFALKKIDKLYKNNRPFLATIMTISDHGPFYIPNEIKGANDKIRASRFADLAKKEFMKKARKKPWFNNTVFVFFGDHGEPHNAVYEIPLTYVHIPLIFYYNNVKPMKINNLTQQTDILSLLMDILKINYVNNTLGKDTFKEKRKYVIFDYDKLYGILDNEFLLILDRKKTRGLYKYKLKDTKDYSKIYPEKRKEMETYLKSHIQGTKYILEHNLQNFQNK